MTDDTLAQRFVHNVEQAEPLDAVARTLTSASEPLGRGKAQQILGGEWMGAPLHPVLTDVTIGCYTSAVLLDLLGGRSSRGAARRLVGLGVLSAVPTAASGASDYTRLPASSQRTGAAHAVLNSVALAGFAWSWWRRRDGGRKGQLVALAASVVASAAGHLGGELVFNQGAPGRPPAAGSVVAEPRSAEAIQLA